MSARARSSSWLAVALAACASARESGVSRAPSTAEPLAADERVVAMVAGEPLRARQVASMAAYLARNGAAVNTAAALALLADEARLRRAAIDARIALPARDFTATEDARARMVAAGLTRNEAERALAAELVRGALAAALPSAVARDAALALEYSRRSAAMCAAAAFRTAVLRFSPRDGEPVAALAERAARAARDARAGASLSALRARAGDGVALEPPVGLREAPSFPAELRAALCPAGAGARLGPIALAGGELAVVHVLERRGTPPPAQEQLRVEITAQLAQSARDAAMEALLETLRERYPLVAR